MTRQEHLDWCKRRALENIEAGELTNTLASMFSDLSKHQETENHPAIQLGVMMMLAGMLEESAQVKKFIEGLN